MPNQFKIELHHKVCQGLIKKYFMHTCSLELENRLLQKGANCNAWVLPRCDNTHNFFGTDLKYSFRSLSASLIELDWLLERYAVATGKADRC